MQEEEAVATEKEFSLKNKGEVWVVPVNRVRRGLPANHENNNLFLECHRDYVVPRQEEPPGHLIQPLTHEEKEYFEDKRRSGLHFGPGDLDHTRPFDDNFWVGFRVRLTKTPKKLDLKDPMQYLQYKVLLLQSDEVAPSGNRKYEKPTFRFAIQDPDYEDRSKSERADAKADAYEEFGAMRGSSKKLADFLKVAGKRPPSDATHEWLKAQVSSFLEDDPGHFLEIIEDKDFETKLLIEEARDEGVILKNRSGYKMAGGDELGRTIDEVIDFLDSDRNSDIRHQILAKVKKEKGEATTGSSKKRSNKTKGGAEESKKDQGEADSGESSEEAKDE